MNPMQSVTSTFTTTVQEESNNWITIHCRSLCIIDCLVAATDCHSFPARSTGRLEPKMLLKFHVVHLPVRSTTGTCELSLGN